MFPPREYRQALLQGATSIGPDPNVPAREGPLGWANWLASWLTPIYPEQEVTLLDVASALPPIKGMKALADVAKVRKGTRRGMRSLKEIHPRVEVTDLSKQEALGAYQPFTGRVMLDRASIAKLSPAERAAVVRHELAHKIDTDDELWKDVDTYLWKLWETDPQHPIFDYMGEKTGRSRMGHIQSAEIMARLYEHDYPTGVFTIQHRPIPYWYESEQIGPRSYTIPDELMRALNRIEDRLGIWGKKQARGTAPPRHRLAWTPESK